MIIFPRERKLGSIFLIFYISYTVDPCYSELLPLPGRNIQTTAGFRVAVTRQFLISRREPLSGTVRHFEYRSNVN